MRSVVIPALLLISGLPMLADGRYQEWRYQPRGWRHEEYRRDFERDHWRPEGKARPGWGYRRQMEHDRPHPVYRSNEVVYAPAVPVVVPPPIPVVVAPPVVIRPPVSVRFWFGF